MPDPRNVYQRLRDVRLALESLPKAGVSPDGGYSYVRWDDVAGRVGKLFAENGLQTIPELGPPEFKEVGLDAHGKLVFSTKVSLKLDVINVDNPEDRATAIWHGEAQDTGDKGIQQAGTSATKYCLMKLLQLSGDSDTEANQTPQVTTRMTPEGTVQTSPLPQAPLCEECLRLGFTSKQGKQPRMYVGKIHPEWGPCCNGIDSQGNYLNHKEKPKVPKVPFEPAVVHSSEKFDPEREYTVGDVCPFDHDESLHPAKFILAKGGPHRGKLQCNGKLHGQWADHIAPAPAPGEKRYVAALADGDIDPDEIPF